MLYIGSDHGGYYRKEALKLQLTKVGIACIDVSAKKRDPHDDYPVITRTLTSCVTLNQKHRGILLCRSGVGMSMAANKIRGIRAVLAADTWIAGRSRRDENSNVLCLPAEHLSDRDVWHIVRTWLRQPYRKTLRDQRRLKQLTAIERER
jgi:ribose 5-phosphate isomerase B